MIPKHKIISDWIEKNIYDGTFKDQTRLLSENKLAEKFNFSRQTVRQAIGTLEQKGLIIKKKGSGTYVSYSSRDESLKNKKIAVITTYMNEYVFTGLIKGIDSVLCEKDLSMSLSITYNKTENENKILKSMLENEIDGLIIEPTKSAFLSPNLKIYKKLIQANIPIVFLNGYNLSLDIPYVAMDDFESGFMATKELMDKGHKSLLGIFKADDIQGQLRYNGFVEAIKENNINFCEENIIWYVTEDIDTLFLKDKITELFRKLNNVTGIVCYNDQIAIRLINLLNKENEKYMQEISIVSFDNSELAEISETKLTSIMYPSEKIGVLVANKLLNIIKNKDDGSNILIKPNIMRRNSVKSL